MITIVKYAAELKPIWDDFIRVSKNGTFMLSRDYVDYHQDRFEDFSLMFYDEEKLLAVMPASLHGSELRSHGGLTYGGIISGVKMRTEIMLDCFASLKVFFAAQGIVKLIYKVVPSIYASLPSEEDLYALFVHHAQLVRRDISITIDLGNKLKFSQLRKTKISKAKRQGVIIRETKDFAGFMEVVRDVLREKYHVDPVHSADELILLASMFPNNVKLYGAYYEEMLVAGSILFIYPDLVHTQYLATNAQARLIGALDLLIEQVIKDYEKSKKYIDFGISTEQEGRYLNLGLIHYKEGFGGRGTTYDTYELLYDK